MTFGKLGSFILLIIITALSSIPLYLYFSEFGALSKYSFENNQSWANFGSFIGGTIGPLFSFIAFIGIWNTYKLQGKQLSQANNQRKSDDVQRLIMDVSHRMDTILNAPCNVLSVIKDSSSTTVHNLNKAIYVLSGLLNAKSRHFNEVTGMSLKNKISIDVKQFCIEADNLAWLLLHQKLTFNEETITQYYNFRYKEILYLIDKSGFKLQPRVIAVFGIDRINEVAE